MTEDSKSFIIKLNEKLHIKEGRDNMLDIKVEKTQCPKEKPGKDDPLLFGTIFTDHMFVMDYERKRDGMIRASFPMLISHCLRLQRSFITDRVFLKG